MSATSEYADIQGIVRYGYGRLPDACFLLARIKNCAAAKAWLRTAPVSNAVERRPAPTAALQIGFTARGLEAMGVAHEVVSKFSPEFLSGMAGEESRSRRLGDVGANAPAHWSWGTATEELDVLFMLYAEASQLEAWKQTIKNLAYDQAFEVLHTLESKSKDDFEPFGFKDGISQPELDWERMKTLPEDKLKYENLTALGEFLLGYINEYGNYSDRPLLPARDDQSADLLPAEENPNQRDLGRNGSYLVLRQLDQDVKGFEDFFGRFPDGGKLAEAMVGRRKNGEPLIASVDGSLNNFTYEADPDGARCPFGAHIRRTNPRNGDYPSGTMGLWQKLLRMAGFHRTSFRDDLVSSTRFHRLLRRGRAYNDGARQGLFFVALNANISRQFEFVQNAWINSSKFDGLSEESDPLLGNRRALPGCPVKDRFSLPQASGVTRRVGGLPQFVRVRGGAYFFLPSLRALRYIATVG